MQVMAVAALSVIFLVAGLSLVAFLISEHLQLSREEISSYECGFEHAGHSRVPFSFRYFLLTLIFLVFDMEIVFLLFLPESLAQSPTAWTLLVYALVFLLLLTMGLFYEWSDGSLDWVM